MISDATPFSGDQFGSNTAIPIVIGASFCFGDEEGLVNCSFVSVTAFEDPNNIAGVQCYEDDGRYSVIVTAEM